MRGVVIDDMNARIVTKLALQIARESRVELKEQQLTIPPHPARDFARMHAFTGAVLGDHARAVEIHFVGDAFDQRLGTRHDRGDLERALQESLEEKGAHRKTNSHPQARHCPVGSALAAREYGSLGAQLPKERIDIDSRIYNAHPSEMSCPFSRQLVIFPHA